MQVCIYACMYLCKHVFRRVYKHAYIYHVFEVFVFSIMGWVVRCRSLVVGVSPVCLLLLGWLVLLVSLVYRVTGMLVPLCWYCGSAVRVSGS